MRRLRRAAHRAEHGRLLERHRQDAAHLPLRRVRRVPLRARVQAPARGPGGEARADGRRRGGAHQAAAVRGRAARRRGVHTARIGALLEAQGGRCASCAHDVVLAAGSGIFMASLDRVGGAGYDDGSAQVLCLGCQRFFNDLDGAARAELTRAVVANAREPRPNHPLAALPVEFERSVSAKLRQMKQREVATDRPSRGAPVELDRAAASRRLCRWGLRCACAPRAHPNTLVPPLALLTRADAQVSPHHTAYTGQCDQRAPQQRAQQCFHAWSFDRVVAGEAYAEETACSRCCIATPTPSTSGATQAHANGCGRLCAGA